MSFTCTHAGVGAEGERKGKERKGKDSTKAGVSEIALFSGPSEEEEEEEEEEGMEGCSGHHVSCRPPRQFLRLFVLPTSTNSQTHGHHCTSYISIAFAELKH